MNDAQSVCLSVRFSWHDRGALLEDRHPLVKGAQVWRMRGNQLENGILAKSDVNPGAVMAYEVGFVSRCHRGSYGTPR